MSMKLIVAVLVALCAAQSLKADTLLRRDWNPNFGEDVDPISKRGMFDGLLGIFNMFSGMAVATLQTGIGIASQGVKLSSQGLTNASISLQKVAENMTGELINVANTTAHVIMGMFSNMTSKRSISFPLQFDPVKLDEVLTKVENKLKSDRERLHNCTDRRFGNVLNGLDWVRQRVNDSANSTESSRQPSKRASWLDFFFSPFTAFQQVVAQGIQQGLAVANETVKTVSSMVNKTSEGFANATRGFENVAKNITGEGVNVINNTIQAFVNMFHSSNSSSKRSVFSTPINITQLREKSREVLAHFKDRIVEDREKWHNATDQVIDNLLEAVNKIRQRIQSANSSAPAGQPSKRGWFDFFTSVDSAVKQAVQKGIDAVNKTAQQVQQDSQNALKEGMSIAQQGIAAVNSTAQQLKQAAEQAAKNVSTSAQSQNNSESSVQKRFFFDTVLNYASMAQQAAQQGAAMASNITQKVQQGFQQGVQQAIAVANSSVQQAKQNIQQGIDAMKNATRQIVAAANSTAQQLQQAANNNSASNDSQSSVQKRFFFDTFLSYASLAQQTAQQGAAMASNITQKVQQGFQQGVQQAIAVANSSVHQAKQNIQQGIDAMKNATNQIVAAANSTAQQLQQAANNNSASDQNQGDSPSTVQKRFFFDTLFDFANLAAQQGFAIANNASQQLTQGIKQGIDTANNLTKQGIAIASNVSQQVQQGIKQGIDTANNLTKQGIAIANNVSQQVQQGIQKGVDAANNASNQFIQQGIAIANNSVQGFKQGIQQGIDFANNSIQTAGDIMSNVTAGLMNYFNSSRSDQKRALFPGSDNIIASIESQVSRVASSIQQIASYGGAAYQSYVNNLANLRNVVNSTVSAIFPNIEQFGEDASSCIQAEEPKIKAIEDGAKSELDAQKDKVCKELTNVTAQANATRDNIKQLGNESAAANKNCGSGFLAVGCRFQVAVNEGQKAAAIGQQIGGLAIQLERIKLGAMADAGKVAQSVVQSAVSQGRAAGQEIVSCIQSKISANSTAASNSTAGSA